MKTGARCVLAVLLAAVGPVRAAAQGEAPRPRVGLALSGGSARGIAHVGVLQWLEEHQVPVDAIAGTSSGAFIGGAYATGMSSAEIHDMLRTADWDLILRPDIPYALKSQRRKEDDRSYPVKLDAGLRHGFRLQSGLNPGHRIGLLLSRIAFPYSTVADFDDLPIPFRCVATDLETGGVEVFDHGSLGPAIRASMALPGTFDPVRLGDRLLSDGGILDNTPVDVALKMGVDVVIAVSVSQLESGPPAESINGVANRAISIMMRDNEKFRLQLANVVIVPDLEGLSASDFRKSAELVQRGHAAAEAQKAALLRYALDDAAWAAHREARKKRLHPTTGPVSFVEVKGVSAAAAAQIARRIETDLAHAQDPTTIEAHLDWLIGLGRYASAMYSRIDRAGVPGLRIEVRDKSYAPPLVRFFLDVDNESKDVNVSLGARITFMDLTGAGSELRMDTSLGAKLRFKTELFQPLGGRGPMRRGAFVAPGAWYERTSESFYADEGDLRAIYSRQRLGAGLDLGWTMGRTTEIRIGPQIDFVRNVTRVGDELPRSTGREMGAHFKFEHDGQDRAYFPTHGTRLASAVTWITEAPYASEAFGRAEGALFVARSTRGHQVFTFHASGGVGLGPAPPLLYRFSLGGPFRLGAFPPNSLRGSSFFLGRAGYRRPLKRLPQILGDRLYLLTMIETGSAFDEAADARVKVSFTAGLAADTFFGPLFVGGSVGNGGTVRGYFVVGSLLR